MRKLYKSLMTLLALCVSTVAMAQTKGSWTWQASESTMSDARDGQFSVTKDGITFSIVPEDGGNVYTKSFVKNKVLRYYTLGIAESNYPGYDYTLSATINDRDKYIVMTDITLSYTKRCEADWGTGGCDLYLGNVKSRIGYGTSFLTTLLGCQTGVSVSGVELDRISIHPYFNNVSGLGALFKDAVRDDLYISKITINYTICDRQDINNADDAPVVLSETRENTEEKDYVGYYANRRILGPIKVQRTVKPGWNTVCFPVDVPFTALAVKTAQELERWDGEKRCLVFKDVTESLNDTLKAGTPYLVYSTTENDITEFTLGADRTNGRVISAQPGNKLVGEERAKGLYFQGNYRPYITVKPTEYDWAGVVNKSANYAYLSMAGTNTKIKGMRAYFVENADRGAFDLLREQTTTEDGGTGMSIKLGDGSVTSIDRIDVGIKNVNAPVYDLSGRRVSSTVKGQIYVQDGVKFMAR